METEWACCCAVAVARVDIIWWMVRVRAGATGWARFIDMRPVIASPYICVCVCEHVCVCVCVCVCV